MVAPGPDGCAGEPPPPLMFGWLPNRSNSSTPEERMPLKSGACALNPIRLFRMVYCERGLSPGLRLDMSDDVVVEPVVEAPGGVPHHVGLGEAVDRQLPVRRRAGVIVNGGRTNHGLTGWRGASSLAVCRQRCGGARSFGALRRRTRRKASRRRWSSSLGRLDLSSRAAIELADPARKPEPRDER